MRWLDSQLDRVDAIQRRHASAAFVHAVLKRHGEERGAWLGAAVSYYGFFSLLPALLAFVTLAYWILGPQPTLLADVLAALWATLPFVGADAREQVKPIASSGPVLLVSLLISIWGAVGVVRVLQDALNVMWCVPARRRPGFVIKLARGLAVLALMAAALFVTGALTALTLGVSLPTGGVVATAAVSIGFNLVVVTALFRVLTARRLTGEELWPGVLLAGTGAYLLTMLGGLYVDRVVARASAIYGAFATVIGLLAWVSLLVHVFVLANLVNVVRAERLWPRTLTGRNLGDGDLRAAHLTMRREALADPTPGRPSADAARGG